jgi:hypothetical protein
LRHPGEAPRADGMTFKKTPLMRWRAQIVNQWSEYLVTSISSIMLIFVGKRNQTKIGFVTATIVTQFAMFLQERSIKF